MISLILQFNSFKRKFVFLLSPSYHYYYYSPYFVFIVFS